LSISHVASAATGQLTDLLRSHVVYISDDFAGGRILDSDLCPPVAVGGGLLFFSAHG
jgi:hypothetical protein